MDCCKNISKKKIFIFCLLGISAVLIAIYLFKVPVFSLFTFGFILLCPLMHLFMMRGHSMKNEHGNNHESKEKELKD